MFVPEKREREAKKLILHVTSQEGQVKGKGSGKSEIQVTWEKRECVSPLLRSSFYRMLLALLGKVATAAQISHVHRG